MRWSDCGNGFECGTVVVPRDYADPGAGTILLALIRLPAIDPAHRIGSLVVNPGGPGASGVDFVRNDAASLFPDAIRERFDIVGFDPRGVARSTPIRCVDNLDHFLAADPNPDTPAELATLLDGERSFVAGCERRDGDLLPYVGTLNVARDVDRIRSAIGDPALTYVGFSYGTLIGSIYADLFPDRVRALVLDGAIDPTVDLAHLREGQAVAFEGALDRFLADCARRTTCAFHNGGRPGPAFDALMRRIDVRPLPAILLRDSRPVGPTFAWDAVIGSLYAPQGWPLLAEALALAQQGDGSYLLALADPLNGRNPDGSYSNLVDANSAVTCLDFPGPRNAAAYEAEVPRFTALAPRLGALFAYNDVDCAFWPVPPARVPAPASGVGAPPILVVGSTGDPATPYAWAVALAHQLVSGVLITRTGEGHTGYAFSACVRAAADTYLLSLRPPAPGTTCPTSPGGP
ncbi:MAG: alpha/beta hydrolase [Candidatus Limnocylindrales bacterium]